MSVLSTIKQTLKTHDCHRDTECNSVLRIDTSGGGVNFGALFY